MPQGFPGTGYVKKFGLKTKREDPNIYQRGWNAEHREELNAYHRAYYHKRKVEPDFKAAHLARGKWTRRKTKYGITKEEYQTRLTLQEGRCIICSDLVEDKLRVDHDHQTGEIRGLLCSNCNTGLGMFKDDPELTTAATAYLRKALERKEELNQ